MEPGEILGEQVGEEEFRIRVSPPRPGARPVTLSIGRAPRRFQPRPPVPRTYLNRDRETGVYTRRAIPGPPPRVLYWVVAGELSEDRDALEHISRHWDFGVALRSALRRAKKLAAPPRRKR